MILFLHLKTVAYAIPGHSYCGFFYAFFLKRILCMDTNLQTIAHEPLLVLKKISSDEPVLITLSINGQQETLQVLPWVSLLDALREYLNLTGTKKGCDHGQCGACTVLVDGKRINSCMTLAVMKQGVQITTIEGLAAGDTLHPLQQAFIDHDAFQCGYCTPGQICSAVGLLNEGKATTRADVQELMSGNICRCGAYTNIVDAIMEVKGGSHE
jgi:xanthine dehydrogenase YagT iron-sulfur-binding subunit